MDLILNDDIKEKNRKQGHERTDGTDVSHPNGSSRNPPKVVLQIGLKTQTVGGFTSRVKRVIRQRAPSVNEAE